MHDYFGYVGSYKYVDPSWLETPLRKDCSGPFADWNVEGVLEFANCYTFACDTKIDWKEIFKNAGPKPDMFVLYMPEPGAQAGAPLEMICKETVEKALIADGLVSLNLSEYQAPALPTSGHIVAAYCTEDCGEDTDYHLYRLGPEGTWFHKRGWFGAVTNVDYFGKVITAPHLAERGDYEIFVGYFYCPEDRMPLNVIVEDRKGNVLLGKVPGAEPVRPSVSGVCKKQAFLLNKKP